MSAMIRWRLTLRSKVKRASEWPEPELFAMRGGRV